jgi:hydroxyethylthiazole kinase-like uncharacterized protein yjeF
MRAFVTALQMKQVDQLTMQKGGWDSFQLMQKVTDEMLNYFQNAEESFLFLCGPGNNGGDGYVLAEKLRKLGREVFVCEVLKPSSAECKKAAKLCKAKRISSAANWPPSKTIVDAIFGYQGRAELPSVVVATLKKANRLSGFRVALDLPTGIESEGSRFHAETFIADLTLCVGFPKLSFLEESVAEFLGRIEFIGNFFEEAAEKSPILSAAKYFAIEKKDFCFTKQKRTSHKGNYGRCGIIGGSEETPGAAFLAAEAAHRVGAGFTTLFLAFSQKFDLSIKSASFLYKKNWKMKDLETQTSLVLGCGGFPAESAKGIQKLISKLKMPCVFDADALKDIRYFSALKTKSILTPHPGEAAKLLQTSVRDIQLDRPRSLYELSKKTLNAVYLKGAVGLLKFPSQNKCYVNLSANPVFAKAGSGDILSGILGGFLAQRPQDFEKSIISALLFQKTVGEILRDQRATIATDQLQIFSKAFENLKSAGNK